MVETGNSPTGLKGRSNIELSIVIIQVLRDTAPGVQVARGPF
jgi:hypothetical protein